MIACASRRETKYLDIFSRCHPAEHRSGVAGVAECERAADHSRTPHGRALPEGNRRGRKRGSELSDKSDAKDSLEQLIAHAEQRIRQYVEQVRSGRFPVQPNGDTFCKTCEYDVMCRIQSLRAFEDE